MPTYTRTPIRKYVLSTRLTRGENSAVRKAAKSQGVTPSKWLGDAARDKLQMETSK